GFWGKMLFFVGGCIEWGRWGLRLMPARAPNFFLDTESGAFLTEAATRLGVSFCEAKKIKIVEFSGVELARKNENPTIILMI
ncbi:MAG: hypothetical protein SNJ11_04130, partial [Rikenellaceae bacterium]